MKSETLAVHSLDSIGLPAWRPMLQYVADLHARSVFADSRLPYPWEDIGPGYCHGPAFGHWDIIHAVLDTVDDNPQHTKQQVLNLLHFQSPSGMMSSTLWLRDGQLKWHPDQTHPPVWPVAVTEHARVSGSDELIRRTYPNLIRQIEWFQAERRATDDAGGYLYTDISSGTYESGIDQGIRFMNVPQGRFTCVDATAHVYWLCEFAIEWSKHVSADASTWQREKDRLGRLMRERLFHPGTGFFHDAWLMNEKPSPRLAIEGIWPMVVGAASLEQANRVIDENLLNPDRFFSEHPLASVGVNDRWFELRMWRGPAWNSITYWAAVGCLKYGRADAAAKLLRSALDASVIQFERTGTIWEFNHPHLGPQEDVQRKPGSKRNMPCQDYLGHNPLIAMAKLYDRAVGLCPSLKQQYVNVIE